MNPQLLSVLMPILQSSGMGQVSSSAVVRGKSKMPYGAMNKGGLVKNGGGGNILGNSNVASGGASFGDYSGNFNVSKEGLQFFQNLLFPQSQDQFIQGDYANMPDMQVLDSVQSSINNPDVYTPGDLPNLDPGVLLA